MQLLHFIVGFAILVASIVSAGGSDERVMGWNKAHGLWGKRSVDSSQDKRTPQNWNKLNSLWGKRAAFVIPDAAESSIDGDDDVALFYKRSAQMAQWQRANGLWGR